MNGPRAITDAQIEAEILNALAQRDPQSSSCPSEIARALAPPAGESWRSLMPRVRHVVARLMRERRVTATRGTLTLQPDRLEGGPIRIRRGVRFER